jgi:hypothetical protein
MTSRGSVLVTVTIFRLVKTFLSRLGNFVCIKVFTKPTIGPYLNADKIIFTLVFKISFKIIHPTSLFSEEVTIKVKGKAVPLHAMEALGGRGGIAPTLS